MPGVPWDAPRGERHPAPRHRGPMRYCFGGAGLRLDRGDRVGRGFGGAAEAEAAGALHRVDVRKQVGVLLVARQLAADLVDAQRDPAEAVTADGRGAEDAAADRVDLFGTCAQRRMLSASSRSSAPRGQTRREARMSRRWRWSPSSPD